MKPRNFRWRKLARVARAKLRLGYPLTPDEKLAARMPRDIRARFFSGASREPLLKLADHPVTLLSLYLDEEPVDVRRLAYMRKWLDQPIQTTC